MWQKCGHSQFPYADWQDGPRTRNPENYFAEIRQVLAFPWSFDSRNWKRVMIKCCRDDSFLPGHTHRHRLGPNYQQIPVNRAKSLIFNQQRDGPMTVNGNGSSSPNYEPHSQGGHLELLTAKSCWCSIPLSVELLLVIRLHWRTLISQTGKLYEIQPQAKTRMIAPISLGPFGCR